MEDSARWRALPSPSSSSWERRCWTSPPASATRSSWPGGRQRAPDGHRRLHVPLRPRRTLLSGLPDEARSRLLTAEGGTGELTSLVVVSGAVFVALLSVAAASRGLIGFAIKANNESLPGSRHPPLPTADRLRSTRCRRPPRSRGRDGDDISADRANRGLRPLARVGRSSCRNPGSRRERGSGGNARDSRNAHLGAGHKCGDVAKRSMSDHRSRSQGPAESSGGTPPPLPIYPALVRLGLTPRRGICSSR